MKLDLTRPAGNMFTGYGDGYVAINDKRYERPLVVAPDRDVTDWTASSFDALTSQDFEALLELAPEIVVFGTGERLRFPHPAITRALTQRAIGVEVMDTRAACRTYNILMSEGRRVVAALLL